MDLAYIAIKGGLTLITFILTYAVFFELRCQFQTVRNFKGLSDFHAFVNSLFVSLAVFCMLNELEIAFVITPFILLASTLVMAYELNKSRSKFKLRVLIYYPTFVIVLLSPFAGYFKKNEIKAYSPILNITAALKNVESAQIYVEGNCSLDNNIGTFIGESTLKIFSKEIYNHLQIKLCKPNTKKNKLCVDDTKIVISILCGPKDGTNLNMNLKLTVFDLVNLNRFRTTIVAPIYSAESAQFRCDMEQANCLGDNIIKFYSTLKNKSDDKL